MRTVITYLACLAILFLPACGILSPQQKAGVRETLQSEYEAGNITKAQRDAGLEALDNDKPIDWETYGIVGANILLALIGGPMIVRAQRGKPTQKVGLPETKIIKAEQ